MDKEWLILLAGIMTCLPMINPREVTNLRYSSRRSSLSWSRTQCAFALGLSLLDRQFIS